MLHWHVLSHSHGIPVALDALGVVEGLGAGEGEGDRLNEADRFVVIQNLSNWWL